MDVVLPPELEQFVQQKVRTGLFADASEVVSRALEAFREQDDADYQAYLKREVAIGIEQLDRGETVDDFDLQTFLAEQIGGFAGVFDVDEGTLRPTPTMQRKLLALSLVLDRFGDDSVRLLTWPIDIRGTGNDCRKPISLEVGFEHYVAGSSGNGVRGRRVEWCVRL